MPPNVSYFGIVEIRCKTTSYLKVVLIRKINSVIIKKSVKE